MSVYYIHMADIENEPLKYPKILELGEIESAINLYLNDYKTKQKDYIQSVKSGDTIKAAKDLADLEVINNILLSGVGMAESTMEEVYPLGIENQRMIQKQNPQLRQMARRLNKQRISLDKVIRENQDIEGEEQSSELESKSSYVKYIFMTILLIIVASLTVRSFIVPNSNSIDTIILIAAIFTALYFLFKKVF